MAKIRVCGIDASLNHGAVVLLENGKLKDFAYYTMAVGAAKKSKRGHRLEIKSSKPPDVQLDQMTRLCWLEDFYSKTLNEFRPDCVVIEDYALGISRGSHYTGELGGIIRMICWNGGYPFRLHDPLSVKMFTAHDGTADKDKMEASAKERWGVDFASLNADPPKGKQMKREISQDMADAFSLAKLGWLEVQLRNGSITLKEMHPKEIQVFNRVTKMYPRSLLDRDWIKKNA